MKVSRGQSGGEQYLALQSIACATRQGFEQLAVLYALEGFLRWTDNALFKFAEWGLVVLLAVHLAGGLRVMALEFLGWRARQKDMVAASAGIAIAAAILFLLNVG